MALFNILLMTFNAFHVHAETYRESPDSSFLVRDTESDPRWGWLGLACETNEKSGLGPRLSMLVLVVHNSVQYSSVKHG